MYNAARSRFDCQSTCAILCSQYDAVLGVVLIPRRAYSEDPTGGYTHAQAHSDSSAADLLDGYAYLKLITGTEADIGTAACVNRDCSFPNPDSDPNTHRHSQTLSDTNGSVDLYTHVCTRQPYAQPYADTDA